MLFRSRLQHDTHVLVKTPFEAAANNAIDACAP
jgi:hypothetical protein